MLFQHFELKENSANKGDLAKKRGHAKTKEFTNFERASVINLRKMSYRSEKLEQLLVVIILQ